MAAYKAVVAAWAPSMNWLYYGLGWALMVLAVGLAYWVLLHDRARDRRRCPKCWYHMDGVPGLTCPECGRIAKSERRMKKTRRRWRWVPVAALLMLCGYITQLVPEARSNGWPSVVPTTALIAASPWLVRDAAMPPFLWTRSPPTDWRDILYRELAENRLKPNRLRQWQWWVLSEIALRQPQDRVATLYSAGTYGFGAFLYEAERAGRLSPLQKAKAVKITAVNLHCRSSWPVGVPLRGNLYLSRWYPTDDTRLVLEPLEPGPPRLSQEEELARGYGCWTAPWFPWTDHLDVMPAPTAVVPCLRYEARFDHGAAGSWSPLCRRPLILPVRIVGSVDEVVHPMESEALAKAIMASGPGLIHKEGTEYYLQWNPTARILLDNGNPTLAVQIEIVSDREVVLTGEAWWWVRPVSVLGYHTVEPVSVGSVRLRPTGRGCLGNGLKIRMTSDPLVALRNFQCDTYWSGRTEMAAVLGSHRTLEELLRQQRE
jgi:hypothetical protein